MALCSLSQTELLGRVTIGLSLRRGGDSRRFSIHAERDCLKGLRADQIYGATLLSVRITRKTESLASSKPCKGCARLLRRKGVESVFWFDSDGNLNRTYL